MNTESVSKLNNQLLFTQYEDPSHSWLEVPYDLLVKLGIEDKITCYSFRKGNLCYLEEDNDWSTFHDAMENAGGKYKVNRQFYNYEAPCCAYWHYRAT